MEAMSKGSGRTRTTSLVLLNTRMFGGYMSVQEMVKPNADLPWGNRFAFLSLPVPKLSDAEANDPLQFVKRARHSIQRKRRSFGVFLTAAFLQMVNKFRGSEGVARNIHGMLKSTGMAITNVIGPMEKMALANHPIRGLYFMVTGAPQSLTIGVISYKEELRVAMQVEKSYIDAQKLKSYVEIAFDMIFKAATKTTSPAN